MKAFDLTFSAPKSVSLLWALGSEAVADVVMGAHREAVAAALGFLEEHAAARPDPGRRGSPPRADRTGGWWPGSCIARRGRATRSCTPTVWSRTSCAARTGGVWRSRPGRCSCGPAPPGRSIRPSCNGCSASGSVSSGGRIGTTPARSPGSPRRSCGRSRNGRSRSKPSSKRPAPRYESPALRMQADDEASLATRPAKDHTATPETLFGRWQAEAADGRPGDRRRARAAGVLARSRPARPSASTRSPARSSTRTTGCAPIRARFAEHDVIEHVAALAAGRLTIDEITDDRRAVPGVGSGRPAHPDPRRRRDGSRPAGRPSPTAPSKTTPSTCSTGSPPEPATPIAGHDRRRAARRAGSGCRSASGRVRRCAVPADAVRTVLAPAGYGKTAMVHAAAGCAVADGRPVIAVATTAKAVAELADAGLPASHDRPASASTSPTGRCRPGRSSSSTRSPRPRPATLHTVLAAVDACPGGQLWVLGDPRQAPSVKAGGIAAEIEPAHRRRSHPGGAADRQPPTARPGRPPRPPPPALRRRPTTPSSCAATTAGNTPPPHPSDTRAAMADAVTADIFDSRRRVARSRWSCPTRQAEDLADRIRRRLTDAGILDGPVDHRTRLDHRSRATRPATGSCSTPATATATPRSSTAPSAPSPPSTTTGCRSTPTAATPSDSRPASSKAVRADGSPNVSHAWARTVDGAQGGTWDHAHLLGTAALDAYRGYTGQSRSIHPTHTWNTATLDDGRPRRPPRRPTHRPRTGRRRPRPASPTRPWPPSTTRGPSTANSVS